MRRGTSGTHARSAEGGLGLSKLAVRIPTAPSGLGFHDEGVPVIASADTGAGADSKGPGPEGRTSGRAARAVRPTLEPSRCIAHRSGRREPALQLGLGRRLSHPSSGERGRPGRKADSFQESEHRGAGRPSPPGGAERPHLAYRESSDDRWVSL
jgi:hypothetical protein